MITLMIPCIRILYRLSTALILLTLSTELTTALAPNTQHSLSGDETLEPTGEYSVPQD